MSLPRTRSSTIYMSSAIHNGTTSEGQTFNKYFECWIVEQNKYLHSLISVSKHIGTTVPSQSKPGNGFNGRITESDLLHLIDRVICHYEDYYRVKSRCAKDDVLTMLSPSWLSSLENAFLWMGGWRPTMAFHLLYSKSGIQLEAALADMIRGLTTGNLADLSPSQLNRIDKMQRWTIREEKAVTEKMAVHQEAVADSEMVELSHAVTEMAEAEAEAEERMTMDLEERALKSKEKGLEEIVDRADELRLRTLKGILEVLTPVQAVHFLIAAAELHLRLHEWGKKRDAR